ncbi:MAG: hypothetical protein K6F54_05560 [Lachnospiraceae bacterium]|nr:hypothetical protein [Lachnospiraceae bacterium]
MGADLLAEGITMVLKDNDESGFKLTGTDTLEPDLSVLQFINGKRQCFLLVDRMPSGILKIRRMSGKAADDRPYLQMVKYAAGEAIKKYPPETPVCIEPVSDKSVDLFEQLFPDAGMPVFLAGANISFEGGLTSDDLDELRIIYEKEKKEKDPGDLII